MKTMLLWLGSILLAMPALAQQPTLPPQIAVRLPTQASRIVQDALRQVARPTEIILPSGVDPAAALRAHCGGSFSDSQYADFLQLNSQSSASPFVFAPQLQERSGVRLPPCPQVQRLRNDGTARVISKPGDSLASLVAREMGATLDERVEAPCSASVSTQRRVGTCAAPLRDTILALNGGGRGLLDAPLLPGTIVQLPAISRWTTLALRENVSPDAARALVAAAISTVNLNTANTMTRVATIPSDIRLVQPLANNDPRLTGTLCDTALAPPTDVWPIRINSFVQRLSEAIATAQVRGTLRQHGEVVRIADTGFDDVLNRFGDALLASDPEWVVGGPRPVRPIFADFEDTRFGFTPERNGRIAAPAFAEDWRRMHGTQVADLATGGANLRTAFPDLNRVVRLTFTRLWSDLAPQFPFNMDTLTLSVRYVPPQPRVLNLSVGGGGEMENFKQVLSANAMLMVVVAAGNDSQNLDRASPRIFPASYGHYTHPLSGQILVVAGHTPGPSFPVSWNHEQHFQLVPESNFGAEIVDILAPGCLIRSSITDTNGSQPLLTGTSYAAPIVSMLAASLASLGLDTPQEIKTRIIASGDYLPWLEGVTRFAAVVNLERAVQLFDTTAQLVDGREVAGMWLEQRTTMAICSGADRFRDARLIRRIDVLQSTDGPPRLRIMMASSPDAFGVPTVNKECVSAGEGITVVRIGQDPEKIPWSALRNVVPAFVPRRTN